MKRKNQWFIIALLAVGVFSVLAMKLRPDDKPVKWQIAAIDKGPITVKVKGTGVLDAKKTVEVGAKVSGRVEKILVDYNQQVKKGQVLAVLDTSTLFAVLQDVNTAMERAEIKLLQAQWEYERSYKLIEAGEISEQEFQQAEISFERDLTELNVAQTAYRTARQNLDYAIIRSPIDGVVISLQVKEGQTVADSYSTPTLFVLAEDLSNMKLEAKIDERDIGRVKEGQKVTFSVDAYPGDRFEGEVKQIRLKPTVSNKLTQYDVIIEVNNPDKKLLPGITASLSIIVGEKKKVWRIPNSALNFNPPVNAMHSGRTKTEKEGVPGEGQATVWIPSTRQKLRKELVKTGFSNEEYTEIIWIGEPFTRVVTGIEQ